VSATSPRGSFRRVRDVTSWRWQTTLRVVTNNAAWWYATPAPQNVAASVVVTACATSATQEGSAAVASRFCYNPCVRLCDNFWCFSSRCRDCSVECDFCPKRICNTSRCISSCVVCKRLVCGAVARFSTCKRECEIQGCEQVLCRRQDCLVEHLSRDHVAGRTRSVTKRAREEHVVEKAAAARMSTRSITKKKKQQEEEE